MGHSDLNDDDDDLMQLLMAAESEEVAVETPTKPIPTSAPAATASTSLRECNAFAHDLENGTVEDEPAPAGSDASSSTPRRRPAPVGTSTPHGNQFSAVLNRSAQAASEAEKATKRYTIERMLGRFFCRPRN